MILRSSEAVEAHPILREMLAERLEGTYNDDWYAKSRVAEAAAISPDPPELTRLLAHIQRLQQSALFRQELSDTLGRCYGAVLSGCLNRYGPCTESLAARRSFHYDFRTWERATLEMAFGWLKEAAKHAYDPQGEPTETLIVSMEQNADQWFAAARQKWLEYNRDQRRAGDAAFSQLRHQRRRAIIEELQGYYLPRG